MSYSWKSGLIALPASAGPFGARQVQQAAPPVADDPLKDIAELPRVVFVMKGGVLHRESRAPLPTMAAGR